MNSEFCEVIKKGKKKNRKKQKPEQITSNHSADQKTKLQQRLNRSDTAPIHEVKPVSKPVPGYLALSGDWGKGPPGVKSTSIPTPLRSQKVQPLQTDNEVNDDLSSSNNDAKENRQTKQKHFRHDRNSRDGVSTINRQNPDRIRRNQNRRTSSGRSRDFQKNDSISKGTNNNRKKDVISHQQQIHSSVENQSQTTSSRQNENINHQQFGKSMKQNQTDIDNFGASKQHDISSQNINDLNNFNKDNSGKNSLENKQ